ncbi:hypothetical protein ACHWQZ_G018564 [Mnemiopsis leidyi]
MVERGWWSGASGAGLVERGWWSGASGAGLVERGWWSGAGGAGLVERGWWSGAGGAGLVERGWWSGAGGARVGGAGLVERGWWSGAGKQQFPDAGTETNVLLLKDHAPSPSPILTRFTELQGASRNSSLTLPARDRSRDTLPCSARFVRSCRWNDHNSKYGEASRPWRGLLKGGPHPWEERTVSHLNSGVGSG